MVKPFFKMSTGEGPVIAAAIHNGHFIREELLPYLAVDEKSRLYEEDPFTGYLADIVETSLVGLHSRFEIDLNREKKQSIYMKPDQAWGLEVWKEIPPGNLLSRSYQAYDDFYAQAESLIAGKIRTYGYAIVYDLHSYNHQREGKPAPREQNPDINIGYNGLDRGFWAQVIDAFAHTLKDTAVGERPLDVRENIKFRGGHFTTWINTGFENRACAFAIEVKKIFMDEQTGEVNEQVLTEIKKALEATIPEVIKQASLLFKKAIVEK